MHDSPPARIGRVDLGCFWKVRLAGTSRGGERVALNVWRPLGEGGGALRDQEDSTSDSEPRKG